MVFYIMLTYTNLLKTMHMFNEIHEVSPNGLLSILIFAGGEQLSDSFFSKHKVFGNV